MKRTERRHLKENELETLARQARETFEARRRETTAIVTAVVIIGVIAVAYFAWRERVQTRAHTLLADAVAVLDMRVGPPPANGGPATGPSFPTEHDRAEAAITKFKVAADAYPSTDAGVYARYQQASLLMTVGRASEAAAAYQQVIEHAGSSIYSQMAKLGLAEAQTRTGQYDQAINAFKDLSVSKDGPLPVDGILMQLGRTYLQAGKRTDAQQTFNRIVEEFPDSPFNAEAKQQLDALKKG